MKYLSAAICLCISFIAIAQHHLEPHKTSTAKTTVLSPAEDDYDVKYVKLDLNMTNLSTTISGSATTKAVVVSPTLSQYVFELDTQLTITQVLINGTTCAVATNGFIRTATIGSSLPQSTLFTVQVFYNGTPASGSGFNSTGINNLTSPSWGAQVTFTLSESYHANGWWPAKQSLRDKIDSSEVWLTVPANTKGGSNGLLQAVTPVGSNMRYEWKERYPIDYYLISATVAPFIDYSYYMHFTGSTDSMLVQNYIYDNPATLPAFQNVIDSTGYMIDYFSTLFGRYPFWKEKYGHCMAPLSGGEEHQTMTTLGFFTGPLIAHELGHQWFGDNVTCSTWQDIFNNEGFASYIAYLFIEHFYGTSSALQEIHQKQTSVKSQISGAIYVDDTTSEDRIFDSRLSYDKGECVLHMLRFVVNNDSEYFQAYKNYQQQFGNGTGTIEDFKNITTAVTSHNLDTFFSQWAYEEGYPVYNITWDQVGSEVYIHLAQTTSDPSSCALFATPAEIQVVSAQGDTTVRVYNDQASQTYHFTWNKTMSGLFFDPNSWLLYQLGNITMDPTLDVVSLPSGNVQVSPNPATESWQVSTLPANAILTLTDITGRSIWQENSGNEGKAVIPASGRVPGLYLLHVATATGKTETYKLVKQ